jgi:tetratricopeptide (TPR) repeat protein
MRTSYFSTSSRRFVRLLIALASGSSLSCSSGSGWGDLEAQVQTIHPRIAFRDSTGREIGPEEFGSFAGKLRWFIEDTDSVPEEARDQYSKARDLGAAGDYDEVLGLLWKAHRISPGWLYPVYDAAWTYFLKGDLRKAEQLYAWVDRMEPRGYSTAKEALEAASSLKEEALAAPVSRRFPPAPPRFGRPPDGDRGPPRRPAARGL